MTSYLPNYAPAKLISQYRFPGRTSWQKRPGWPNEPEKRQAASRILLGLPGEVRRQMKCTWWCRGWNEDSSVGSGANSLFYRSWDHREQYLARYVRRRSLWQLSKDRVQKYLAQLIWCHETVTAYSAYHNHHFYQGLYSDYLKKQAGRDSLRKWKSVVHSRNQIYSPTIFCKQNMSILL